MTTQEEIDARFAAMQPDPTRKLDELQALKDENARLRAVAEAARETVDAFKTTDTSIKQMLRLNELERALDALGQGE